MLERFNKVLGVQDVALLVGLGSIAVGLAFYDWRLALVITGSLVLGLTVWGLKSGHSKQSDRS